MYDKYIYNKYYRKISIFIEQEIYYTKKGIKKLAKTSFRQFFVNYMFSLLLVGFITLNNTNKSLWISYN